MVRTGVARSEVDVDLDCDFCCTPSREPDKIVACCHTSMVSKKRKGAASAEWQRKKKALKTAVSVHLVHA